MNELQVTDKSVKVRIGSVTFTDYELIKSEATELATLIRSTEVSEENIKTAKRMLASLNKSVDELEARRIAIKRAILTQYNVFEGQIKEIVTIVRDADNIVRQQVRDLEELERDNKRDEIGQIWDQRIQHYDFEKIFTFEDFIQPQHLNKSVSLKKVEDDLVVWLTERENDIQLIMSLADSSELMSEYVQCMNLATAMRTVQERRLRTDRVAQALFDAGEEKAEKVYMFIIHSEKDAKLTEMLLKENKITYSLVVN